jgi:hypothetical protein
MNPGRDEILKDISSIAHEEFSELEYCYYKQIDIPDLSFTLSVSQDLDKYKSQSRQTVILPKEQQATNGDVVFSFITYVPA